MSEVSFARTYLALLATKPTKVSATHVEDPTTYPARSAYILPRLPRPLQRPSDATAPSTGTSAAAFTLTLTSPRNPTIHHTISDASPTLSVHDLKTVLSAAYSIPSSAIRVLHKKRPVNDSKVLKDFLSDTELASDAVDLGVMVIGGAAAVTSEDKAPDASQAAGQSSRSEAEAMLKGDTFWKDLEGFLMQRLKDESLSRELLADFEQTWKQRNR